MFLKRLIPKSIFYFGSVILFSSCSVVGINVMHSTPKKPFKYPTFTLKDSLRGQLNHYRSCYDVHFYNLNVDINTETKEISGLVDIHFSTVNSFDTLQLDLYENISLDSIICENHKLNFYRKYNAVFVLMGRNVKDSENIKMTAFYHGKPQIANHPPWEGGFVWDKDKNGKPWIGVACEVDGASLWWPVKDHLSDEPDSMAMNFTVPSGLMCVSNGQLKDSVNSGNKTTYRWKVSYPINSYDATFYIGDYRHFSIPYKALDTTFNLDFYVLPYNLDTARSHFRQTAEMLHFYESAYGPYPWPRDGYKLVESSYEGMEHQTAIAYGYGFKDYYGLYDFIILHESAHEWWGNSVTVPDYAEIWIHEGFASYSEMLYLEHIRGHQMYLKFLTYFAMLIKNKRPVVGPYDVNYWDYKDADVYMKGALTLHTLRNTINNDSVFFDILKSFYSQHKYKSAVTKDFISLVNEKTGKDYSAFFEQYLYTRTCPELQWEYAYNKEKRTNELYYRWTNAVKDFKIPIKVVTDSETIIIHPEQATQKVTMNIDKNIKVNTEGSYIALKRNRIFK
jgi:aminopeptidase N